MHAVRLSIASTVLAIALGCGGVWSQAMNQVSADKANELEVELMSTTDSPERARALAAVARFGAQGADASIMGIVEVESSVERAVSDGEISATEADQIEAAVDEALKD